MWSRAEDISWSPVGCKNENGECGREYLLGSCPTGHAALRESVKHNGCHRITTLYLLNYTRVRADEHGSHIRSSVHLTSVEPGLTEVGQRLPHRGHLRLTNPKAQTDLRAILTLAGSGIRLGSRIALRYGQVYIQLLWHPENPKRVSFAATITVKQEKVNLTLETGRWGRGI